MKGPVRRDEPFRLRTGIIVLFALLPVSMPAHLLVNHALGKRWCWYSAFLYPESILAVCLLGLVAASADSRARVRSRFSPGGPGGRNPLARFSLIGVLFVGWTALTALLQSSHADFWLQRLLAGWVFPMAMTVVLFGARGREGLDGAWTGLAAGATLLLGGALVLYFVSFGVPGDFRELVFQNRTSKIHGGLRAGIYFGELTLGGVNDVAVFFAAGVAAAWGALVSPAGRKVRWGVALWLACALTLEFLCYSRGAIVSLGGAGAVYLVVGVQRRLAMNLAPPLVFAAFAVCALLPAGATDYWKEQLKAARGTSAEFRVSLWKRVLQADPAGHRFEEQGPPAVTERADREVLESTKGGDAAGKGTSAGVRDEFSAVRREVAARSGSLTRRLLLGYGPGNFGVVQGMTFDAGTHNLFLDALASSGLPALALVGGLWISLLVAAGRAAIAAPTLPIAGGRQFAVTAQSLLAVVFVLFLCAVFVNLRVDNLGTSLFGALLWLLIATVCEAIGRRANADSDEREPLA